ncbi:MAG: DUF4339 domain-containing protein [Acidobacteria bacterium]|nr:DUF4339 domain-containing protein [Acidobacteriota bacterium]
MNYYMSKSGMQYGPFTENEIVEKLRGNEFSPSDLCIPVGGSEWKQVSTVFPNVQQGLNSGSPTSTGMQSTAPKKGRWKLILGSLAVVIIGLVLVASVLGFLAYRNIRPADSLENLPNQVKDFKLKERYPGHGDVWGTRQWYAGMYSIPPSEDYLIYLVDIFGSESRARLEQEGNISKDCKSDAPLRFAFKKDGVEVAEGATCGGPFYIIKGNRIVSVGGGKSISIAQTADFMENLPFLAGSKMERK